MFSNSEQNHTSTILPLNHLRLTEKLQKYTKKSCLPFAQIPQMLALCHIFITLLPLCLHTHTCTRMSMPMHTHTHACTHSHAHTHTLLFSEPFER